jgi:hypothetical protein
MTFRVSVLSAIAVLAMAAPALAQSQGTAGSGGQNTSAGGTSVSSGTNESSVSVETRGANVGVVQGSVAEGSTAGGSQGAAAGSGGASGGSTAGTADAPNALNEGVLEQLDLPAMDTATEATPAGGTRPNMIVWALAAAVLASLVLLYRRLPRPSTT